MLSLDFSDLINKKIASLPLNGEDFTMELVANRISYTALNAVAP